MPDGRVRAVALQRDAFADVRDEIPIVTKAGARPVPGAPILLTAAQQPAELRAAVEENLATWAPIGSTWSTCAGWTSALIAEGDQGVPFEDQLAEMSALREEGKI